MCCTNAQEDLCLVVPRFRARGYLVASKPCLDSSLLKRVHMNETHHWSMIWSVNVSAHVGVPPVIGCELSDCELMRPGRMLRFSWTGSHRGETNEAASWCDIGCPDAYWKCGDKSELWNAIPVFVCQVIHFLNGRYKKKHVADKVL